MNRGALRRHRASAPAWPARPGTAFACGRADASRPRRPPASAAAAGRAARSAAARLADTVPDFQLADRDGQPRSLARLARQVADRQFLGDLVRAVPARDPVAAADRARARGEGFQVVGIAVDFRDKVLAYADEMEIEYPLLIGEQDALDAAAAFGVDAIGFPFTVFTDAQGRVVAAHMGELTAAARRTSSWTRSPRSNAGRHRDPGRGPHGDRRPAWLHCTQRRRSQKRRIDAENAGNKRRSPQIVCRYLATYLVRLRAHVLRPRRPWRTSCS